MTDEQPSISCPKFRVQESIIARLTQQINAARTVAEKAPKAEGLIEVVEELLDCCEYEEESLDCRLCHNFSELRKKTAELILKAGRLAR